MEINREKREEVEAARTFGDAINDLLKVFEPIARAFKEILERAAKFFRSIYVKTRKVAIKWYQLEEEKQVTVRQHHRRDFSRHKIKHQVINRKPRQFNRKIIR
ncbi:hypothetical protein [Sporosarcina sp. E16_8]|uniref:hypothetical protein n=1 Tax=Sporosarcina sp. E16_8 TaxID=2789295 RepID=UPI001A9235A4|nr:hypothetical protein [Sporosarcina sp. E16_8]MBO0586134.1 hypothetical protein [Sporosarcina sp. E16_8]